MSEFPTTIPFTEQEFINAMAEFLQAAQEKVNLRFENFPSQSAELTVESGSRYDRVVETYNHGGRSVFCFVDRTNGNVLKAASWKKAETKNPRSNIFDADFGASGVSGYGAVYLR